MANILLFAHGGSGNHGCEAIVRSTCKLLKLEGNDLLLSSQQGEEVKYGIQKIIQVKDCQLSVSDGLFYRIAAKLFGNPDEYYYRQVYRNLSEVARKYHIALSIGGDNYCYSGLDTEIKVMRNQIAKAGCKTVLWGCSVDTSLLSSSQIADLKKYNLIVARESLTYDSLLAQNFKNVVLAPDPAFALERVDRPLPDGFIEGNTVGINVSPLITQHEGIAGITMANYSQLIQHIIDNTEMQVALIPHVVWTNNDDREPLLTLYDKFQATGRVVMIEDYNAEELKGYIARCRFMIAARTHASIAAYSQQIPTLVIGYSIKARGIARDLFGTADNYVLGVQSLKEYNDLTNAFNWLFDNEGTIRQHMAEKMPEYCAKTAQLKTYISNLK